MEGKSTGVVKRDKPERNSGSGSSEAIDYGKICQTKAFLYTPFFHFSLALCVLLPILRDSMGDVEVCQVFFLLLYRVQDTLSNNRKKK